MRILESHRFGPHEVVLVENAEDEGITYSVLVDRLSANDQPLLTPPDFEEIVRLYYRSQTRGRAAKTQAAAAARRAR